MLASPSSSLAGQKVTPLAPRVPGRAVPDSGEAPCRSGGTARRRCGPRGAAGLLPGGPGRAAAAAPAAASLGDDACPAGRVGSGRAAPGVVRRRGCPAGSRVPARPRGRGRQRRLCTARKVGHPARAAAACCSPTAPSPLQSAGVGERAGRSRSPPRPRLASACLSVRPPVRPPASPGRCFQHKGGGARRRVHSIFRSRVTREPAGAWRGREERGGRAGRCGAAAAGGRGGEGRRKAVLGARPIGLCCGAAGCPARPLREPGPAGSGVGVGVGGVLHFQAGPRRPGTSMHAPAPTGVQARAYAPAPACRRSHARADARAATRRAGARAHPPAFPPPPPPCARPRART